MFLAFQYPIEIPGVNTTYFLKAALNEIRKLRQITLIVSEQVLSFALAVADRILVLERGRIIHEDRREDADVAKITGYLSV